MNYGKTPKNPLFLFVWRICQIIALFAKIRQVCTSDSGSLSPLNRAVFCLIVYPIGHPQAPPEREYEVLFFPMDLPKRGFLVKNG
jgi:hypothetical protein